MKWRKLKRAHNWAWIFIGGQAGYWDYLNENQWSVKRAYFWKVWDIKINQRLKPNVACFIRLKQFDQLYLIFYWGFLRNSKTKRNYSMILNDY